MQSWVLLISYCSCVVSCFFMMMPLFYIASQSRVKFEIFVKLDLILKRKIAIIHFRIKPPTNVVTQYFT